MKVPQLRQIKVNKLTGLDQRGPNSSKSATLKDLEMFLYGVILLFISYRWNIYLYSKKPALPWKIPGCTSEMEVFSSISSS